MWGGTTNDLAVTQKITNTEYVSLEQHAEVDLSGGLCLL